MLIIYCILLSTIVCCLFDDAHFFFYFFFSRLALSALHCLNENWTNTLHTISKCVNSLCNSIYCSALLAWRNSRRIKFLLFIISYIQYNIAMCKTTNDWCLREKLLTDWFHCLVGRNMHVQCASSCMIAHTQSHAENDVCYGASLSDTDCGCFEWQIASDSLRSSNSVTCV